MHFSFSYFFPNLLLRVGTPPTRRFSPSSASLQSMHFCCIPFGSCPSTLNSGLALWVVGRLSRQRSPTNYTRTKLSAKVYATKREGDGFRVDGTGVRGGEGYHPPPPSMRSLKGVNFPRSLSVWMRAGRTWFYDRRRRHHDACDSLYGRSNWRSLDRPFFFPTLPSVLKRGFWKLDFF